MPYPEIHIWDFPPTKTYLRINEYRIELLNQFIKKIGTHKKAGEFLSQQSKNYGKPTTCGTGAIIIWSKGKRYSGNGLRYIPLSAAIEISKVLSNSGEIDNPIMRKIEENIEYILGRANGTKVYTKFPLQMTPELVSIIFHFCGDGFLADNPQSSSSYKQVNRQGLMNFAQKLQNSFGQFRLDEGTLNDYKVLIPRVISDFYRHYFKIDNLRWDVARIPSTVKNLSKEHLLAGLTSFIVDEGHIGDSIEIYSANQFLLSDIEEIIKNLGYSSNGIHAKPRKNGCDYRIYISCKSAVRFNEDIQKLKKTFPTCDLVHKQSKLRDIVQSQTRTYVRKGNGVAKQEILELLEKNQHSAYELAQKLRIKPSSVRGHLVQMEKIKQVQRETKEGYLHYFWKKSSNRF